MFLETVFFSGDNQTERPILLKYADGVTKTGIGLMYADQHGTAKVNLSHQECLSGPLAGPNAKFDSITTFHHWGKPFTEQLKNLMSVVKNCTALDNIRASLDKSKIFRRNHKISILAN